MKITETVWLGPVIDKIAVKHHVEVHEVEEVLKGKPRFRFVEKGKRAGEDIYMALGQSYAGRYLTILFIHKTGGEALILSARDMAAAERKRYERK